MRPGQAAFVATGSHLVGGAHALHASNALAAAAYWRANNSPPYGTWLAVRAIQEAAPRRIATPPPAAVYDGVARAFRRVPT